MRLGARLSLGAVGNLRDTESVTSSSPDSALPVVRDLPALAGPLAGWHASRPDEKDVPELTALLARHEKGARGWGSFEDEVLVAVSQAGSRTRQNVVLRDADGALGGWATAHDRASGRMLLTVVVDRQVDDDVADRVAETLFEWADGAARRIGSERGLHVQQIDSGAFADDERQHRWLQRAGFHKVRTWWQMTRPVTRDEAGLPVGARDGVRIRRVRRQVSGMPDEDDLRTVHDILESAFADHFNSHEETFDEFVSRLREDPGHRWDHWWVAEIVDENPSGSAVRTVPAGALVGSVSEGTDGGPGGSYVEYIGVLESARGRGVAKSLLRTVIADAASNDRDRVGLEVDADSPSRAEALYVSMGWTTSRVTESWHRDVRTDS